MSPERASKVSNGTTAKRLKVKPVSAVDLNNNIIEFHSSKKYSAARKVQATLALSCCSYWILNSTLGVYLISQYPDIAYTHPELYTYLCVFSAKWFLAFLGTIVFVLFLTTCFKVCYRADDVFSNTIGIFPVVYLVLIFVSYMYSFYYGVILLQDVFGPPTKESEDPYLFKDDNELTLIKAFILNEVIVGALVLIQFVQYLCCGKLSKSAHLNEIEGEGFGVSDEEIIKI